VRAGEPPRAPGRARFAWAAAAVLVLALVLRLGYIAATPDYRIVQLGTSLAGTYNDASRDDREHPASWRSLRRVPEYQHLTGPPAWRRVGEARLERELRAAALRFAADHPAYVADVAFWSTVRALDLAGLGWSRHTASTVSVAHGWADAGVFTFWAVAALALAGALTARGRRIPLHVAAVPALLYLSVVFLAFETPRYRPGIDPFVVLLAAVALVAAWDAVRRRSGPRGRPRPAVRRDARAVSP
jgi:hypothetical protein